MIEDPVGRIVGAVVGFSERRPWAVLAVAVVLSVVLGVVARGLEVRSDLLELLPRDSPGFRAFEHQLGRTGGGATLIVIVSSPDRAANERFVDDLAGRLASRRADVRACRAACNDDGCRSACGPDTVSWVESGTKDVRAFYEANKWLYSDLADLERADRDVDRQIAIRSGLVVDLEAADEPAPAAANAGPVEQKPALGLGGELARWEDRAAKKDAFPTGYFETEDGTLAGIRILTRTRLGDAAGDLVLADIERTVKDLRPDVYDPRMQIGFTGDIPSAVGEKKALVSEAASATTIALAVIVLALVLYFRSAWAVIVVSAPALFGVVGAAAFASVVYGYVNTSGAFLGAIILGNGVNYPIVLLSRYQEFRARGMEPAVARREAVRNALRAELVGACVASIAYGSLVFTRFRGFSQFGVIGFCGMQLVWLAMIPTVPALLVVIERIQGKLPPILRDRPPYLSDDGSRSWALAIARAVTGRPRLFVALGLVVTTLACLRVPAWVVDPWEYDFGKLGSRKSDVSGAGEWSNKANLVFGGKMNIAGAMMLADRPDQVPELKARMLENDLEDPQGTMLAEITTIDDLLPGTSAEQRDKLAALARIRARLSDRLLGASTFTDDERRTIRRARPPETLRELTAADLPPLLQRRFSEDDGRTGTVFYVKPRNDVVFADGHNHLRLARTTDNVRLADGTVVMTASRSTIFAEMLSSMRRDGPLVSAIALGLVTIVVVVFARSRRTALAVLASLVLGVTCLLGGAAITGARLNYVNFVALPITFGIGAEYPFNIADRVRLLSGDVRQAVARSAGAVLLCSFTTIVGYGSLAFSDFQALESFGKLAVAGELACVFGAVLFLPALLTLTRGSHIVVE